MVEHDEGMRLAVLSHGILCGDKFNFVQALKATRLGIVVVGTGTAEDRASFLTIGVDLFLERPFVIDDLIDLVAGRIRNCADCGLPLPLRRPRSGDAARSWVCRGCGARYYAILDDECSADVLNNVRGTDGE